MYKHCRHNCRPVAVADGIAVNVIITLASYTVVYFILILLNATSISII